MRVKITKEIEIEIDFPAYYKYAGHVKIISPDSYIKVRVEGGEFLVDKLKEVPMCVRGVIENGRPCSAEEFKAAYAKAMNHVVHEGFLQEFETATRSELRKEIYESNIELCNAINEQPCT